MKGRVAEKEQDEKPSTGQTEVTLVFRRKLFHS